MKKRTIKYITLWVIVGLLTACSQRHNQSLETMLKDSKQQEKVLEMIVEDHDLSSKYIGKMIENDHATNMMVDGLVSKAAKDSVLAGKISNMIAKFPDLMLLTTHHFMPIIDADKHMCDGFCNHALEHSNIAEGMCHKMQSSEKVDCCAQ